MIWVLSLERIPSKQLGLFASFSPIQPHHWHSLPESHDADKLLRETKRCELLLNLSHCCYVWVCRDRGAYVKVP
jgi:hypothetical protein